MSDMLEASDQAATERSPLLGSQPEEAERPTSENHASSQDGPATDVEPNRPTEETEDPELVKRRKNVKSLLPVLGVGIFLAFLDQSIVAAINGEIGSDLHALRNVSWIATAYFLTMTASQPLYGKLSDIFGRKPCLLFAYTMFGLGSLGCGITSSMGGLIAGRVCHVVDVNRDTGADNIRQFKESEEEASSSLSPFCCQTLFRYENGGHIKRTSMLSEPLVQPPVALLVCSYSHVRSSKTVG